MSGDTDSMRWCMENPPPSASPREHELAARLRARRTPEAQADIAAARAAPTAMEVAMQEIDRVAEQAVDDLRNAPTAYRTGDEGPAEVVGLETVLSNAALADTSAVREMGALKPDASFESVHRSAQEAMARNRAIEMLAHDAAFRQAARDPDAIVLTGPEAERYRAIAAAARKAQASASTARADGAALLQLFQAFCAGLAPAKEG